MMLGIMTYRTTEVSGETNSSCVFIKEGAIDKRLSIAISRRNRY